MARPVTARRLRTGVAVPPAPAATQKQARAHPTPQVPAPPRLHGARLRVKAGAYHLLSGRGGAVKNGVAGSREKRIWNVNAEEELENEAWKPYWVRFVLFAGRLPLRNGEKRGFESPLCAESELRSQLGLASVFWSVKWINQACPTAFADL